jgi:hypothetical protein
VDRVVEAMARAGTPERALMFLQAASRPGRQPLPRHHPARRRHRFEPAFGIAAAVADYVAWRAENPR